MKRLVYKTAFSRKSCFFLGIRWQNIVERERSQMRTWRMRIACWIP